MIACLSALKKWLLKFYAHFQKSVVILVIEAVFLKDMNPLSGVFFRLFPHFLRRDPPLNCVLCWAEHSSLTQSHLSVFLRWWCHKGTTVYSNAIKLFSAVFCTFYNFRDNFILNFIFCVYRYNIAPALEAEVSRSIWSIIALTGSIFTEEAGSLRLTQSLDAVPVLVGQSTVSPQDGNRRTGREKKTTPLRLSESFIFSSPNF